MRSCALVLIAVLAWPLMQASAQENPSTTSDDEIVSLTVTCSGTSATLTHENIGPYTNDLFVQLPKGVTVDAEGNLSAPLQIDCSAEASGPGGEDHFLWSTSKGHSRLNDYNQKGGSTYNIFSITKMGRYIICVASGDQRFRLAVVVGPLIVPADDVAGVLGDIVPSSKDEEEGSVPGERHFVSPRSNADLPDDLCFVAKGVSKDQFEALYTWECEPSGSGYADPDGDSLKYWVRRNDASTPIKLKIKSSRTANVEVDKMNVWIVWADGSIVAVADTRLITIPGIMTDYHSQPPTIWRFKFSIQPLQILTGDDIPNLKGASDFPAPGANNTHILDDRIKADNADFKWDVSRRLSTLIRNTGLMTKATLTKDMPTDVASHLHLFDNQPKDTDYPVVVPTDPAEGNDDSPGYADESDNPYEEFPAATNEMLAHGVGDLTSYDAPSNTAYPDWGAPDGSYFADETDFFEFTRVQLWDGQRSSGRFWFRISDDIHWHHYFRVKFSSSAGDWLDNDDPKSEAKPNL